jgi:hypothetical protein
LLPRSLTLLLRLLSRSHLLLLRMRRSLRSRTIWREKTGLHHLTTRHLIWLYGTTSEYVRGPRGRAKHVMRLRLVACDGGISKQSVRTMNSARPHSNWLMQMHRRTLL